MPIQGSWSCLSGCGWEKKRFLDGWQARRWKKHKLNYRTQVFPGGLLEETENYVRRQRGQRETLQNDQQKST